MSIVMPVFNGGAYLTDAVDSLLAQTLSDFELVAVDDGSEDGSLAVLEAFRERDRRVRPIVAEHQGIVAALNRGLTEARAEYVAIANADDVSVPERLAHQARYLDEHEQVAVVGSTVETIDVDGRPGHRLRFPSEPGRVRATLREHNCLAHPSVMFRRSAVAAVGGYRIDYAEDYDLWLRISEHFDLANLPEVLVLYRIHPGQISLARIDEMERLRLAVRAAARARVAGLPDPLEGVDGVTPAVFAQLGIDDREVERAARAEWISRAAILAELDSDQARNLIGEASAKLGPRAAHSFEAARELLRAESCLASGRRLRAMARVTRAFIRAPVYTSTRLVAWLTERSRGAMAS